MKRPSVVFQPETSEYLLRGVDLIADAVRPTLGPLPRHVAYEQASRTRAPELLADAGTLARRIVQIGDGPADIGAMLMRQAIWTVGERVGDGAATTAVMAQAMFHHAHRMVAAGANAMRVREGAQQAIKAATQALRDQATPLNSQAELTQVARSFCHDDELSKMVGEIYSVIGPEGYVDVQNSNARTVEREYVEGAFWRSSGWVSSAFSDNGTLKRASLQNAAVVLVDGRIESGEGIGNVMGAMLSIDQKVVVIICRGMSEAVISALGYHHHKDTFKVLPIQAPALSDERRGVFEDVAVLTGAIPLAGTDTADLSLFRPEMAGRARRVWADPSQFGLIGGKGSPKQLRAHMASLRNRMAITRDKDETTLLRKRLGRLTGGTAVILVGAPTETERNVRRDLAERSVRYMQTAAQSGVVAGGGAALLACQAAVRALETADLDVRAGFDAVARALEEPMRAIARNAGQPETATVEWARRCEPGYGLNALSGEIVDMRAAGILDNAGVLEQALEVAGSVTSMLLTTDTVVRHRKPSVETTP